MSLPKTIDYQFTVDTEERIGGFHQEIVSTDYKGHEVSVSSGFGMGNLDLYVSLNGSRLFTISAHDFLRTLIDTALGTTEESA